jgi:hypothetical protein
MGSALTRSYIENHSDLLAGAIVCGTLGAIPGVDEDHYPGVIAHPQAQAHAAVQSFAQDATDFAAAAIQEAESTAITAMYLRTRRLHEHCGDIPPIDSRRPTTLNALDQPPAELSNQRVSGLTGAVRFVEVVIVGR